MDCHQPHKLSYTKDCQLPPEILLRIFNEFKLWRGSASCFTLAHVCRFWRATALGACGLWTHVRNAKYDEAVALLRLSRTAPLTVWYDSHDPLFSDQLGQERARQLMGAGLDLVISDERERIEEVYVAWGGSPFRNTARLIGERTPLLHTVHLDCLDELEDSAADHAILYEKPSLRAFSVDQVLIREAPDVQGRSLQNLRELSIVNAPPEWELDKCLSLLGGLRSLESLSLESSVHFEPSPTVAFPDRPVCTLPVTLSELTVMDFSSNLVALLVSCEIPSTTSLCLIVDQVGLHEVRNDMREIGVALRPWISKVDQSRLELFHLRLGCGSSPFGASIGNEAGGDALEVTCQPCEDASLDTISDFLEELVPILSFCHVRDFWFEDGSRQKGELPVRGLMPMLPHLARAERLSVIHQANLLQCASLEPFEQHFPQLTQVKLVGVPESFEIAAAIGSFAEVIIEDVTEEELDDDASSNEDEDDDQMMID